MAPFESCSGAEPITRAPSVNSTLPVGSADPLAAPTTASRTTGEPIGADEGICSAVVVDALGELTVCEDVPVDGSKLPLPTYRADSACVPTARPLVVSVARCDPSTSDRGAEPSKTPSAVNSTAPPGAPPPGATGVTFALIRTGSPAPEGSGDAVSTRVVAARFTVKVT